MTVDPKPFNEVFESMRQRTTVLTDFEVGSVARTMYESFSYEIALLYEKMQLVYLSAYVDTADGQSLDRVVAVLGIKRGLPDFAEGVVTFQRDVGNQDITIPIGTLVATVDTPDQPKKVYQTNADILFPKDQTTVTVPIQAVNRGEEEVVVADALVVLPRPIPGIKSVTNGEATRFTGKRRETDEGLRQRAKNALISSGKATLLSIENALLSLPGVKDVKVRENFRYAKGEVVVNRGDLTGEIEIPKDLPLTAMDDIAKPFRVTERRVMGEFDSSVTVPVQSLLEGKAGEVLATATWTINTDPIEPPLASLSLNSTAPAVLESFGVIDVVVDCVKFDDPAVQAQLQSEIDRVRAAGIFVLLKSVVNVNLDGIFQIEASPDLALTPEERTKLEHSVRDAILTYIDSRQMGQPLLFPQIVKSILSMNSISNLEDFQLKTTKELASPPPSQVFDAAKKRIDVEEFERFKPRYLCVASEIKPLPVNIQYKATDLDGPKQTAIAQSLTTYFNDLKVGSTVEKGAIATLINAQAVLVPTTLKLSPQPWCQTAPITTTDPDTVVASFVEQPSLGTIFAYSKVLQITGALKLTLPTSLTDSQKQEVYSQVRAQLVAYLDRLDPESDVVFADMIAIAAKVNSVTAVDLDERDFRVLLDGQESQATAGRISKKKIDVQSFEKTQFNYFCVTSSIEPVNITLALPSSGTVEAEAEAGAETEAKPIVLELIKTIPTPAEFNEEATKTAIKQAVRTAVNNFFTNSSPGQSILYAPLKSALENLVPGIDYNVKQLALRAESTSDNRLQETSIDTAKTIDIRSVEIATMTPLAIATIDSIIAVTVTTITPVIPPQN